MNPIVVRDMAEGAKPGTWGRLAKMASNAAYAEFLMEVAPGAPTTAPGAHGHGGDVPSAPSAQGPTSKSKRQRGAEALYRQERPWTEAIIDRRRKSARDSKDAK